MSTPVLTPPGIEPPVSWKSFNPFRFFVTGPDAPRLADQAEIDATYRQCRHSILVSILFGYGFLYTCKLGFSVVKPNLIDGGVFTTAQLGVIGSGFMYVYGFGRLFNGFLADHANLRKFFAVGVLLSAVTNLVMASSTIFWLWVLLWGMNGLFQGFGAPSCIVSIARWFGGHERGRAYGVWSASHSIGEGLTFVGTASLVVLWARHADVLGPAWRAGFIGPGIFCLFVAVGVLLLMRDRPQTLGLPSIAEWQGYEETPTKSTGGAISFREQLGVLRYPALWVVCLASATMYMTRYGLISWGMLYLEKARGFSPTSAGLLIGANTAAGLGGCIAYGFISDLLFKARRPPVTFLFGLVEVIALIVMFYTPVGHPIILGIAFVVYGFTLSGLLAVLGGLFAVDIVPKKAAGAAIGMTGVFSYLAAGLQERISAFLLHRGESVVNGVHHFNFHAAIIFWIGASVVSMLLAASLWWTKVRE